MINELFSGPELIIIYELVRRYREELEASKTEVDRLTRNLDAIADHFELHQCPRCLEYQLNDDMLEFCDDCCECNTCTGGALVCDFCESHRCANCSCDCTHGKMGNW